LAALLEHLHTANLTAVGHFRGDDLGWTGGELVLGDVTVIVERYLTKEDELRNELNTWAGWLETRTDQSRRGELMQHVIGTKQLVTLKSSEPNSFCDEVCRWVARQTDAVFQVDGRGFFAADGTMLLPEEPS
jgi:hypothetical protein